MSKRDNLRIDRKGKTQHNKYKRYYYKRGESVTDNKILERVKLDLRIDFSDLDKDIEDNIAAALLDLGTAGVNTDTETMDMLTLRAVKLYCRWQYNFDGRAEQYEKAYYALKTTLAVDRGHQVQPDHSEQEGGS